MKIFRKIRGWIFTQFSRIRVYKTPMFVIWGPKTFKFKQTEKVLIGIKPGDVILRRYDGFLSTFFIPGYYSHVGIYLGDGKVLHSIAGRGVTEDNIINFCRTDHIEVVRFKKPFDIQTVLDKANSQRGKGYDFDFEKKNNALYCSELVANSFSHLTTFIFKRYRVALILKSPPSISPDAFVEHNDFESMYESK